MAVSGSSSGQLLHQQEANHDLPPAVAFHILDATNRLTTHYRPIPLTTS
ncbi:hypothetical protein AB0N81_39040 [Streptomyces sp. NPDC093510]